MRDWDDHRLVLTLHRQGTLRASGDALGVTHTTIARRLAAIEAKEPTPLFTRLGRAYQATEYGLERVAVAKQMEALDHAATRLQRRSGDTLSGPLSLSIPQAVLQYLLLRDIGDFAQRYPHIELTIVGTDQLADLDRGDADVVIRGQANPPGHLVGRKICDVTTHHYAHRDYLDTTRPEDRKWIAADKQSDWIADSPFPDCPVGIIMPDIQSRFLALASGQGLSRAACFMAEPHPDLVRLDSRPGMPLYGLWVLTHPDLKASPKVKALMRAMTDALSRQKALIAA
ncbi:LysR family transcriptional regulator [Algimonas porphyrae]|nr:LysR family transcriptional regulator [Algimonas porphyrae]